MSDSNKTTVADILHGVAETLQFMLDQPQEMTPELLAETATWIVEQLETPQVIEWQCGKETVCDKLSDLQERMEKIELSGMVYDGVSMVDIFEQPNPVFDERFFRWFVLFIQKLIPETSEPKVFEKLPKPSRNPERDAWIVERKEAGDSHKEIMLELNTKRKEFDPIRTKQGIAKVLQREKKRRG